MTSASSASSSSRCSFKLAGIPPRRSASTKPMNMRVSMPPGGSEVERKDRDLSRLLARLLRHWRSGPIWSRSSRREGMQRYRGVSPCLPFRLKAFYWLAPRSSPRRCFLLRPSKHSRPRTRAARAADSSSGNCSMAGREGRARAGSAPPTSARCCFIDGKYIEFYIVTSTFGIRDYAFTGAPNAQDITGGRRTPVWSEKTPDHRGSVLTSAVEIDNDGPDIVLERSGTNDLDMKIQAKDCAQGGVFQMEPERGDHTATVFTHVLAPRGVLLRQSALSRARRGHRALQGHDGRGAVAGQHRQRLLAQVRRSRQRAGRRAD